MLTLTLALSAFAQTTTTVPVPEMNAQLYRAPIDAERTMWTQDASTAPHLWATGRLYTQYVHGPLGAIFINDRKAQVIGDVLAFNLVGGVQLGPVRLGVDAPVYALATSDWEDLGGGGLGDIALDAKTSILRPSRAPLGLALGTRLALPTATVNVPLGATKPQGEIVGIFDKNLGNLLVALNLGVRLGPEVTQGNVELGQALVSRLGLGYSLTDRAGISLDGQFLEDFRQPGLNTDGVPDLTGRPGELMLGGWGRINDDFVLRGGLGAGLTDGVGASAVRAIFSFGYEPSRDRDTDLDGILDSVDLCPQDAEDIDGFEDTDGCPELDNDGDGIVDAEDACALEPEDVDEWQDDDGCPDPTTIARVRVITSDGKPVGSAKTVLAVDGQDVVLEGGAYELELLPGEYLHEITADGYDSRGGSFVIPAGPPTDIEVMMDVTILYGTLDVAVVDTAGAPIEGATFSVGEKGESQSASESVRLAEGEYTVVARAEGYAPAKDKVVMEGEGSQELTLTLAPTKVKVSREKIEILDKVFFDTSKTTIKEESFELLNEIAQILIDRIDILEVRIEGHTDSRGSDASNLTLSQGRAASVRQYLVDAGVEAERLVSEGFGESKPLEKAENRSAWAKNRRVEFVITKWAEDE